MALPEPIAWVCKKMPEHPLKRQLHKPGGSVVECDATDVKPGRRGRVTGIGKQRLSGSAS